MSAGRARLRLMRLHYWYGRFLDGRLPQRQHYRARVKAPLLTPSCLLKREEPVLSLSASVVHSPGIDKERTERVHLAKVSSTASQ